MIFLFRLDEIPTKRPSGIRTETVIVLTTAASSKWTDDRGTIVEGKHLYARLHVCFAPIADIHQRPRIGLDCRLFIFGSPGVIRIFGQDIRTARHSSSE